MEKAVGIQDKETNITVPVFVGRETELQRLKSLLEQANAGKLQVAFIAGEAGAGKSALVTEFVRREEEANPALYASMGECNAQTGITDPYLPFRQVLTAFTSEQPENKLEQEAEKKKLNRWKEFVQVSTKTLIMLGPDLVGIFVPGSQFITRIGTTIALNSNLAAKLSERVGKKQAKESPPINPTLDQEKIFEQYTQVVRALAKDRTLVIVLDDLQWADSGSINLLFHLARQVKDSRLLLVGTYRPDDLALGRDGGRHPLEPVLNELKRYYGDIVIDLTQAGASEGRTFVEALVDSEPNHLDRNFRDELFAHTGGHPLFTVELLRSLQERGSLLKDTDGNWIQGGALDWNDLPVRVEGVIGERIARLPTELHEILTTASVVGEEFAAQVVALVQNSEEREVVRALSRELEKRYMLVAEQGETRVGTNFLTQYQFTHNLIQQYLYAELSKGERRLLHDDAAQALELLYGDQSADIAQQLAHHYEAAGNEDKAINYLTIAADGSYRAYAYTEAISAYTRALELAKQSKIDTEQLIHLYANRGRALELNGQYDQAVENYNAMLLYAQKRQDQAMELSAKVAMSTLYATPTPVTNINKAQELCDETLELSRELGDRTAEAKVLWNMQLMNLLQNKAPAAIEYGEKSLAIARELNLREQMAYVLSDLGWAYNVACQFDKSDERMSEGASLWRELGNMPMLSNHLNTSLYQYYWTGKNEKVMSVATEAYELSGSIKELWNQASARNFQAQVWLDYGDIDQAIAAFEESTQLVSQGNRIYELWYNAILSQAYAELGAVERSTDLYRTYRVPNSELPNTPSRTSTLIAYAMVEMANEQLDTAAESLEACTPDAQPWECLLQIAKGRLALARKETPNALQHADSALKIAETYKLGRYLPEALFLKGQCQVLQGASTDAKGILEQARSAATTLGSRRLLWRINKSLAAVDADKNRSAEYTSQAGEIVDYIAENITSQEMKQSFIRYTSLDGR